MPRKLAAFISATDLLMLLYWALAALVQFGAIHVPRDWMYARYDQPDVVAWNWSFLPLDVAFSVFGLASVAASRRGDLSWRPLALISLVLTAASGLMAISYWTVAGEFDGSWFAANLALIAWPLFFLRPLVSQLGSITR